MPFGILVEARVEQGNARGIIEGERPLGPVSLAASLPKHQSLFNFQISNPVTLHQQSNLNHKGLRQHYITRSDRTYNSVYR